MVHSKDLVEGMMLRINKLKDMLDLIFQMMQYFCTQWGIS